MTGVGRIAGLCTLKNGEDLAVSGSVGPLGNQFYIFATHLLLPDSVANAANEQVGLIVISCLSVDATNQADQPFFLDIN